MIPQLKSLQNDDVTKSVFYGPINLLPKTFSDTDKKRLTEEFINLITNYINPSYKKLENFLRDEYLPKARTTSGAIGLPNGEKIYSYLIRQSTTTRKTPDELFNTGMSEVNLQHQGRATKLWSPP